MFETSTAVIDYLGTDTVQQTFGVTKKRVDQCRRENKFPASWYDSLERMTGRPLPRTLFTFKDGIAAE